MSNLTTKTILEINDDSLVHTRTADGSILILKAGEKTNTSETYLIEGLSIHVFEALDGKKNLSAVIKDLEEEFLLDDDAVAAFPDFILEFAQDLVKEGIARKVGRK